MKQITSETVLEAISQLMAEKEEKGVAPFDQVTLLELSSWYPEQQTEMRTCLNDLWRQKKIKVGPTMNGQYIRLKV